MISLEYTSSGKTERSLRKMAEMDLFNRVNAICKKGVSALEAATPKESGVTAASWDYEIRRTRGGLEIVWTNSHVNDGAPIAILLQYGHGTGTGGWVPGRDYINPAMQPIFDEITEKIWSEVKSA